MFTNPQNYHRETVNAKSGLNLKDFSEIFNKKFKLKWT